MLFADCFPCQDRREQHRDSERGPRERGGGSEGGDKKTERGEEPSSETVRGGRSGQHGPAGTGHPAHKACQGYTRVTERAS